MPGIVPSKNFYARAVVILLVFGSWFFLFRSDAPIKKTAVYNRNELLSVQSRSLALATSSTQFPEATTTPESEQDGNRKYLRIFGTDYSADKLTLIDNIQDQSVIKNYGMEVKTALTPFSNPARKNEVELMFAVLDRGSAIKGATELATLKELKSEYDTVAKDLTAMNVPESAAQVHLALVNIITRFSQLTANMTDVLNDPIRAVASAQEFAREQNDLLNAFQAVNTYFADQGITFTPSEAATLTIYEIR